jgi:hypothetical protein
MVDPVTVIAGVSAASSIFGGLSAGKKAKKAAKQQANLTFSQRMEELRRARQAAEQRIGYGRAATGASNVMFSGTPQNYLNAMTALMEQDQSMGRASAIQERKAIRAGASGVGSGMIAQGVGDLLGMAAARMFQPKAPSTGGDPGLGASWAGNDPFKPGGSYG